MSETERRSEGEECCPLSVVVVTYNEADRIEDCLDSIFGSCEEGPAFEVILVDSRSTDGTVEKARKYPITVCQLPQTVPATPGAGRYVGSRLAAGEYVLFVDGDMILQRGWLPGAIRTLESTDAVAVDGHINQSTSHAGEPPERVDYVRGVALYDGAVLREEGGFDPFMRSVEDIHLGYRLTDGGRSLLRLPEVIATHPQRGTLSEPFRRLRRGYSIGSGQAIRRSLRSPSLVVHHLARVRYRLILFGWLWLGLWSHRSDRTAVRWWLLGTLVGTAFVVRKRGLLGGLSFGIHKFVALLGLVVGFCKPPRSPTTYPLDGVEVIQRGPVHDTEGSADD